MIFSSELWAMLSLLVSSFVSATLLPGSSEILLVALLVTGNFSVPLLIAIASIGNTLGGLTNVVIGRLASELKPQRGMQTVQRWIQRYGVWTLLFSWLPVVGDVLCLLAGWQRLAWRPVIAMILIGKTLRYIVIAVVTVEGISLFN